MSKIKKIKERGNSFKKKVAESIDVSGDLIFNDVLIKICGRRELVLENYKGILDYSDKMVSVSAKPNNIRIDGKNLEIKIITDEILHIRGEISAVYYSEE